RAFKYEDFESMLVSNRFEILHVFGNFTLDKFNVTTSDRLIIVARKV
ncbi:MAG: SAM-dependent methyltransferase, partial [Crocinitomicaceae bacterium]|nr:SAM-dependent methyltransferase [Crocinitomicaceae bacterium]